MANSNDMATSINMATPTISATSRNSENTFFRLLDLPAELRLMIYERITSSTSRHTLDLKSICPEYDFGVVVIRQSLSTAILATCNFVRQEAEPILLKSLAALEQRPMRVECSMVDLYKMNRLACAPERFDNNEGSTLWMMLGYIYTVCPAYWTHISKTPRASQSPSYHLEIAVTTPPAFDSMNFDGIWYNISWDVYRVGVSCAIYHKGTLQPAPGSSSATGIGFWHNMRSLAIATMARLRSPRPDGEDPDSIVKVVEVDEKEWDRMIEDWNTN